MSTTIKTPTRGRLVVQAATREAQTRADMARQEKALGQSRHPSRDPLRRIAMSARALCSACEGQGLELGPRRTIPTTGASLTRIRPCSHCEGHGVEPRPQDGNFLTT